VAAGVKRELEGASRSKPRSDNYLRIRSGNTSQGVRVYID
jgi:hypothetical protein